MPAGGGRTGISNERIEDVTLPGLIVAPRPGPGPLHDDNTWPEGLHLTSDARTLVDNLAVSRGRAGRPARTLSRDELEDWVVRTAQRRPDGWLETLRPRALELCDQLGVPERSDAVRSEEHTSELQSLMRTSYAVFCLKTKHKHK